MKVPNVCGSDRSILGVVYPRSSVDLRKIVSRARKQKTPLYPISTGKNWGLGARLPVRDRQLVVDLSRMNRILSFDPRNGILVIEPGVTQSQIAAYLRKRRANYVLNVTGSSKDSSVLGNALERGVAHYGCRVPEILSLEAVLGTGKTLSLGGASARHSRTRLSYPYGIGPDLRGMFFQSNFGIVTRAAIRLRPKPKDVAVVHLQPLPGVSLARFVDLLRTAKRKGLLPDNLHLSNQERRLSVLTPILARSLKLSFLEAEKKARATVRTPWAATASFEGETAEIRRSFGQLKRLCAKIATANIVFRKEALSLPTRGTFLHSNGVPSDDAIPSLGFSRKELLGSNPVDSSVGTLFVVPILPFQGREVAKVMNLVRARFEKAGFAPFATFNLVEDSNFEAVINLTFDRDDPKQVKRAHACVLQAFRDLTAAGYPPQRMSVFQMPHARGAFDPGHAQAIRELKRLLDPDGIIAPGRYEP